MIDPTTSVTIGGGDLTGGNGGAGGTGGTGIGGNGGAGGGVVPPSIPTDPTGGKLTTGTGGAGGAGVTAPGEGGLTLGKLTAKRTSITVNPAKVGWTYELYDENGKMDGQTKTGAGTSLTFDKLTAGKQYTLKAFDPDNETEIYIIGSVKTTKGGGGGDFITTTTGITVPTRPGGTVTVTPKEPEKGQVITITVKPDKGYILNELTVTDPKGTKLTVTPMGDGKYQVTMPNPAVKLKVDATFQKATNDPKSNGVGIINGVGDGSFAPGRTITRAEFVTIAARFATAITGGNTYSDVSEEHWAAEEIITASAYGWIGGYTDGTFKPDNNILRSEAVKVANAMLGRRADKAFIDGLDGTETFSDVPQSDWAFYEIMEATHAHDFDLKNGVETWKK